MQFSTTITGVMTAFASVLTACAAIIGALAIYRKAVAVERDVKAVHVIVNQERTDRMNYQRALIRALESRGIAVPVDQSIPPADSESTS